MRRAESAPAPPSASTSASGPWTPRASPSPRRVRSRAPPIRLARSESASAARRASRSTWQWTVPHRPGRLRICPAQHQTPRCSSRPTGRPTVIASAPANRSSPPPRRPPAGLSSSPVSITTAPPRRQHARHPRHRGRRGYYSVEEPTCNDECSDGVGQPPTTSALAFTHNDGPSLTLVDRAAAA